MVITVKMKQIETGHWEGRGGTNFSVIGLSEEGNVYKYSQAKNRWVPYSMKVAAATDDEDQD